MTFESELKPSESRSSLELPALRELPEREASELSRDDDASRDDPLRDVRDASRSSGELGDALRLSLDPSPCEELPRSRLELLGEPLMLSLVFPVFGREPFCWSAMIRTSNILVDVCRSARSHPAVASRLDQNGAIQMPADARTTGPNHMPRRRLHDVMALSTLHKMRLPPPLTAGARVALVAPAGPLRNSSELDLAIEQARGLGWDPVVGDNVLAKFGYLAGEDAHRVSDLNAALRDDSIDGIWCVRGGYGALRLLDALDVDAMRRHPKALIGYSDITALHAAFVDAADVVTFHGPTARSPLSAFSRASLARAVVQQRDPCGVAADARTLRGGRAEGRLVGGNLALLAALCGTPFAPDYTDAILVVEDVGEQTYRIDRMLRQLSLSGALSRLAGIAFGHFTEGTATDDANSCALDDILREAADNAGVPALAGIPLGHIDDQWTLPLGAMAELDADARALHVALM